MCILACFLLAAATSASARDRFDVALIGDGPGDRLHERVDTYVSELRALTQTEFDVRIYSYLGNWNHDSIVSAIEDAYADPEIDMLLVTGFVANQIASMRTAFPT